MNKTAEQIKAELFHMANFHKRNSVKYAEMAQNEMEKDEDFNEHKYDFYIKRSSLSNERFRAIYGVLINLDLTGEFNEYVSAKNQ